MKKVISLILAALFLISFIGCSGGDSGGATTTTTTTTRATTQATTTTAAPTTTEPEEEVRDLGGVTIKFANWGSSSPAPNEDTEQGRLEKEWRDELEAKYNFKFDYEAVPGNDDASLEKFVTTTMAGDPFTDICAFMMDSLPSLAGRGLLYPLDTLESFDFIDSPYISTAVRDFTKWSDGHYYGYSTSGLKSMGNKTFLAFNKAIAEREGLPNLYELYQSGQWTWEKLYEYAAKATRDLNNDGVIDQFGMSADVNRLSLLYVSSTGVELVDSMNKVNYNNPLIIEAMEAFYSVKPFWAAPPDGANWDWNLVQFGEGNILFNMTNYTWAVSRFSDMTDDYGFLPFPPKNAGDPYYVYSDAEGAFAMPYNAKNPEEAAFVVGLLTQTRPWNMDESGVPLDELDPLRYLQNFESIVRDEESLETIRFLLEEATFIIDKQRALQVFWSNPGWSQFTADVWNGVMTPEQAAQAQQGPTQEKIDYLVSGEMFKDD